jgi:hypothetical protein
MYNKNLHSKNSYYLKGDFGLKYQLSNIYFMPQISSIQLSLNFTKFLKGLDFKALQKKKKGIIKIKLLLLLFLITNIIPLVLLQKKYLYSNFLKRKDFSFLLQATFRARVDIFNFLMSIIIENNINLLDNVLRFSKDTIIQKATMTINFQLPLTLLHDCKIILNSVLESLENIYLSIRVTLRNTPLNRNLFKFMKNHFFFWFFKK